MQLEVERKYRIAETGPLHLKLAELGVLFAKPERQQDDYFNHPSRDFAMTDEALRIRSVGSQNFVTYKGPKLDRTVKTRRELELSVCEGREGAEQFAELLAALGFRRTAQVVKFRSAATLSWNGTEFQICWDEVERLGSFLEIELIVDAAEAERAREKILALEQEIGLTTPEPRSYLSQILALGPTE